MNHNESGDIPCVFVDNNSIEYEGSLFYDNEQKKLFMGSYDGDFPINNGSDSIGLPYFILKLDFSKPFVSE